MIRFLTMLSLLLLAPNGFANISSWPRYENKKLGVRLSYPDDFEVLAESNDSVTFGQRANGREYGYAYPSKFSVERDFPQGACVEHSVCSFVLKERDVTRVTVGKNVFCRVAYLESSPDRLHISLSLLSAPTGLKLNYVMQWSQKSFLEAGGIRQDSPMMLGVIRSVTPLGR
jgi:hypothetical protein